MTGNVALAGALEKMLVQHGGRVIGLEPLVNRPVGKADEAGAFLAILQAARPLQLNLIRQAAVDEGSFKRLPQIFAAAFPAILLRANCDGSLPMPGLEGRGG